MCQVKGGSLKHLGLSLLLNKPEESRTRIKEWCSLLSTPWVLSCSSSFDVEMRLWQKTVEKLLSPKRTFHQNA